MSTRHLCASLAAMALSSGLILAGCQFLPGGAATPDPSPSASQAPLPAADVEACEHMSEGPATLVTAALNAADAPDVSAEHQRYEIALLPESEHFTGKIRYTSNEEAHYVWFFDQDTTLEVRDAQNTLVTIESQASASVACGGIKARYVIPLDVGLYTLQLGPTTASTVSLVVEAEGGHDDEHDHAH